MTERLARFELERAGERIAGDRLAGGSPCYLFLHGLGSVRAGEKSTSLLAHARRRGRAFARFDFRGHGESTGRIGHATIGELVEDTLAVLDLIGPSIVVGSSLGGLVGAFAAAERPASVAGLVLLAPAFGFLARMAAWAGAAETVRNTEGIEFTIDPRVLRDAARWDEDALPPRLSMPVLAVHGEFDDVVPPVVTARFVDRLATKRKELWVVPAGDHRLNREIEDVWPRMDALV